MKKKKYKMNTDLQLQKGGLIVYRQWKCDDEMIDADKKERFKPHWEYIEGVNLLPRVMKSHVNETFSVQKGVTLKDFMLAVEPLAKLMNVYADGWLVPLMKEWNKDKKLPLSKKEKEHAKGMKYLEVYKNIEWDLSLKSWEAIDKQISYFQLFDMGFHGLGKPDSDECLPMVDENGLIAYGLSFCSIFSMQDVKFKVCEEMDLPVIHHMPPFDKKKYSWKKFGKNGLSQLKIKYDKKEKEFHGKNNKKSIYNIKDMLEKEMKKRHKVDYVMPKLTTVWTFAEVVRAVFWEMSWHGTKENRDSISGDLEERIDELEKVLDKDKEK